MDRDDILREIRQTEDQLDHLRSESQRAEQDYEEELASAQRKMKMLYQVIENNYENTLRHLQQQQGDTVVEDSLRVLQRQTNRWKESLESVHYQHCHQLQNAYEERKEDLYRSKLHLERELDEAYYALRTLE